MRWSDELSALELAPTETSSNLMTSQPEPLALSCLIHRLVTIKAHCRTCVNVLLHDKPSTNHESSAARRARRSDDSGLENLNGTLI